MSNANTPAMMAQSMAESLFRENARLKKIEESYYRLLELDSGDVMIDTLNEIDRLKEQIAVHRKALEHSVTAIDDWLHLFASEQCDEARVDEAIKRISENGTLYYIATVQRRNRAALSALPQKVKSEDEND